MRGTNQSTDVLFVDLSVEAFVPKDHSLHPIRQMVDTVREKLSSIFVKCLPPLAGLQIHRAVAQCHAASSAVLDSSHVKLVNQIHFSLSVSLVPGV